MKLRPSKVRQIKEANWRHLERWMDRMMANPRNCGLKPRLYAKFRRNAGANWNSFYYWDWRHSFSADCGGPRSWLRGVRLKNRAKRLYARLAANPGAGQ
jgi:hypothetical protein